MFFLTRICRSRYFRRFIALIATLTIILLPAVAAADGETYTWKDSQHSSIEASGGPYASSTEFAKQGNNTYTATNVALNCTDGSTGTSTGTSKLTSVAGGQYQIDNSGLVAPAGCTAQNFTSQFSVANAAVAASTTTSTNAASSNATGTCDQGSVSWIMCPVLNNISNSISGLAKDVLAPLLQVNSISAKSTPALYQAWQHIRDFADVLFILIFMVIIFGTITEQDIGALGRYHIKTIWPRLVIAAILVQFSFFLSGFIIDVGNVLGAGVQGLLVGITGPTASATPANLIGTLVAGGVGVIAGAGAIAVLASWTVALPLILSLMISLLVGFLTLGARFLILAVLVVLAPLAMVAWVLPNTEHVFTSWHKLMLRLVMMYPIVIGVITLAGIVNQILPFGGDTTNSGLATTAVAIIKPLIVVAAFMIIPVSFRWAGRGMEQVHGLLSRAGKSGKGALRDSTMGQRGREMRQRRQASQMSRWMNSSAITRMQASGWAGRRGASALNFGAGLAMMNAPKDKANLDRRNSQLVKQAVKELESLDEASVPNLHRVPKAFGGTDLALRRQERTKLRNEAPNLYRLASTRTGQEAVIKRLSDLGLTNAEDVQNFAQAAKGSNFMSASNNPDTLYPSLLGQIGKESTSKPLVANRMKKADPNYMLKDAAGNEIGPMPRAVGDIDLNEAAKNLRRVKGNEFGDKFSPENIRVMTKRHDSNPAIDQAAQEAATVFAQTPRQPLVAAMDPTNNRTGMSLETRITWMKGIQMNADIFKAQDPEILKASTARLEDDTDLTNNLLKVMGVHSALGVTALSAAGRAHVVRDWINQENYDPYHDYETSGKIT